MGGQEGSEGPYVFWCGIMKEPLKVILADYGYAS
jgi:hypothetical protein